MDNPLQKSCSESSLSSTTSTMSGPPPEEIAAREQFLKTEEKDTPVQVKETKKTTPAKKDSEKAKPQGSLRAKVASQEAERRQKKLSEAKERVQNYRLARRKEFVERSSARLPGQLIVTKVLSVESVLSQWRGAARNRWDLAGEVSPFYSKYASVLKTDEDITVQKAINNLCESVVPNDTVGCGWLVGAANVQPKEIVHLPKPGSYQSVEEFLTFFQEFERTETPILDPKYKLNYEDTHKWLAVMTAVGCKFSPTYYGALKFVVSQIKRNQDRFTGGGALAITELDGAIQSCFGVDNTTKNLVDYATKRAFGRREWTTEDLLSALRDPNRKDKLIIRKELEYRASGNSNKFYLGLLNIPSTKAQLTAFNDAVRQRIWLKNCLDQCEQQQAYVKWICSYFHVNSKYRSSINEIPYQIYIYLLNTQVTEEQKKEIEYVPEPKVVQAPEKTGTPVDNIVDAEYSNGPKKSKQEFYDKYPFCEECGYHYEKGMNPDQCGAHTDFRIPSDVIATEGCPKDLIGYHFYHLGCDNVQNFDPQDDEIDNLINSYAIEASDRMVRGYSYHNVEQWFTEKVAKIRDIDASSSNTALHSCVPEEVDIQPPSTFSRVKKWVSSTADDIKTAKEVWAHRKLIGQTLQDVKDQDLIKKASKGIDEVITLTKEIHERGMIRSGDELMKKLVDQLDELNKIKTDYFTPELMANIKRTLENSDTIISAVSRLVIMIDPIMKGVESYFPKEVREWPSFSRIIREFPYVAALIALVTWSKTSNRTLRTIAILNFLAQAGVMNVVMTIAEKVWSYLQKKFSKETAEAETEAKTSASEGLEEVSEGFFASLISFVSKHGMNAAVWTAIILAVGSVCKIGVDHMLKQKDELESVSSMCAKGFIGAGVTANAGFRIGQFIQMTTSAMKSIAGFFYKCVTGKEWQSEAPEEVKGVRELIYAAGFYTSKTGVKQMTHYQQHLENARDVLKRWDRFVYESNITGNTVSQRFVTRHYTMFEKLRVNVSHATDYKTVVSGDRVPPTVVYFYGPPGGGKSSIVTKVIYQLCKNFYAREGEEAKRLVASLNLEREFQDAVTSETKIAVMDDYNSVNDAKNVVEMLQIASGTPYFFNKADLPDKPTPCNIEFLFLTSNQAKLKAEGANCPEALDRRRDILVKFDLKATWKTKDGVLDMAKWNALTAEQQAECPHVDIYLMGPGGTELPPDSWVFKKPELVYYEKDTQWAAMNPIKWDQLEPIVRHHHHMRRAQNADTRKVDPFADRKSQMKALYEMMSHYLDPDDEYGDKTLEDWGFPKENITFRKIYDTCKDQLVATMDEIMKDYAIIEALRDKKIDDMIPAYEDLPPMKCHDKSADSAATSADERLYGVFWNGNTEWPVYHGETRDLQSMYTRVKFDDVVQNTGNPENAVTRENVAQQIYTLTEPESRNIIYPHTKHPFSAFVTREVPYNPNSVKLPEDLCKNIDTGCDYEFLRRVKPLSRRVAHWLGVGPWRPSLVERSDWFLNNLAAYDKNVPTLEEREKIRQWVVTREKELACLTKTQEFYWQANSLFKRSIRAATSVWEWLKVTMKDLATVLIECFLIASIGSCVTLTFLVIREAVRDEVNYVPITSSGPYSGSKESGLGKQAIQAAKSVMAPGAVSASTSISDPVTANLLRPTDTEQTCQLKAKILQNQRKIQIDGRDAHGIFVTGNLMLVPAHVLPGIKKTEKVKIYSFGMFNGAALEQEYRVPYSRCFAIENRDIAMIQIENHTAVKSILKYFPEHVNIFELFWCDGKGGITVKYLDGLNTKNGVILTYKEIDAVVKDAVETVDLNNLGETVTYANILTVNQVLPAGSSGAIVVKRYPSQDAKIIVGIVTGRQTKRNIGYVTCVTRAEVESLVKAFDEVIVRHDVDVPGAEVSWADPLNVPADLTFDGCRPFYVGTIDVSKAINPFPRSKLRPSPIASMLNQTHTPDRAPVIPHRFDPRWMIYESLGIPHPLSHSLMKGVRDKVPEVDWTELNICVRSVADYITRCLGGRKPRVLTFEEAITNESGRMNPHSSPGRLWKVLYPGYAGKLGLFRLNDKGEIAWVNPVFKEYCEVTFDMRKQGVIPPSEFYVFLKDELRPLEKVWKGRQIDVGGAEESLHFRRLFGDLFNIMVELGDGSRQWCFGINPSADWQNIGEAIRAFAKGQFCSANDVQNWDGHQTLQWVKAAVDVCNLIYQDGSELRRARRTYGIGMVSAYVLFGPHVIQKERGMSSGSGCTTMINTMIHMLVGYFIWRQIVHRHWNEFILFQQSKDVILSFAFYNNVVVQRFYSDDTITSVNPLIASIYTPDRVANLYREIGLPVTTSAQDKGSAEVEFVSYTKIDFLKREFRWNDQLKRWFACLRPNVLYDMTRWVRATDPLETRMQFASNFKDAVREAAQHGKPFFDAFTAEISAYAAQIGIILDGPIWEDIIQLPIGRIIDDPGEPVSCVMAGPLDEPERLQPESEVDATARPLAVEPRPKLTQRGTHAHLTRPGYQNHEPKVVLVANI